MKFQQVVVNLIVNAPFTFMLRVGVLLPVARWPPCDDISFHWLLLMIDIKCNVLKLMYKAHKKTLYPIQIKVQVNII